MYVQSKVQTHNRAVQGLYSFSSTRVEFISHKMKKSLLSGIYPHKGHFKKYVPSQKLWLTCSETDTNSGSSGTKSISIVPWLGVPMTILVTPAQTMCISQFDMIIYRNVMLIYTRTDFYQTASAHVQKASEHSFVYSSVQTKCWTIG